MGGWDGTHSVSRDLSTWRAHSCSLELLGDGGAQSGRSLWTLGLQLTHDWGWGWGGGWQLRTLGLHCTLVVPEGTALRGAHSLADFAFELQIGVKLEADGSRRGTQQAVGSLGRG